MPQEVHKRSPSNKYTEIFNKSKIELLTDSILHTTTLQTNHTKNLTTLQTYHTKNLNIRDFFFKSSAFFLFTIVSLSFHRQQ